MLFSVLGVFIFGGKEIIFRSLSIPFLYIESTIIACFVFFFFLILVCVLRPPF